MDMLYKMFLDGTPLNDKQIDALLEAGLIERGDNGSLVPKRQEPIYHQSTIDELTRHL